MVVVISGNEEKLKKMQKEDAKIVKGRFYCYDPKGGNVKFSYRKYKGEPIRTYVMYDGKDYEIPVGVAKHINNCGWDVHQHALDRDGNPSREVGKRVRRFSFQSLEFIDG